MTKDIRFASGRPDDAVTRILRAKFAMGLMDSKPVPTPASFAFGTPEHRAVARQAVRESLVLLKNDHKTLPLSKDLARIHVAGKSADDIGNQCGGWTISWQGKSGDTTTGGTTILAALRKAGASLTSGDANVGIVVIGETPYAEGMGDRTDLSLSAEDIAAVKQMKSTGIPVVVIVISVPTDFDHAGLSARDPTRRVPEIQKLQLQAVILTGRLGG